MKELLPILSFTNIEKKDSIEEMKYYIQEIKNITLGLLQIIPVDEDNVYWTDDYDPFDWRDELNRWFVIEQLDYINKLEEYLKDFSYENINSDFENFRKKLISLRPMWEEELPAEFFMNLPEFKKFEILVSNNVVNILFWIMNIWKLIYKNLDEVESKKFEDFSKKLEENEKLNTILEKEKYWFNATLVIPDSSNKKQY